MAWLARVVLGPGEPRSAHYQQQTPVLARVGTAILCGCCCQRQQSPCHPRPPAQRGRHSPGRHGHHTAPSEAISDEHTCVVHSLEPWTLSTSVSDAPYNVRHAKRNSIPAMARLFSLPAQRGRQQPRLGQAPQLPAGAVSSTVPSLPLSPFSAGSTAVVARGGTAVLRGCRCQHQQSPGCPRLPAQRGGLQSWQAGAPRRAI